MAAGRPPLRLYVHWPYCSKICTYCDFNRYLAPAGGAPREVMEAYPATLRRLRELLGPRALTSVFFGGGTPSLAPPELIHAVVSTARELFPPREPDLPGRGEAPAVEVTLEANPTSSAAGRYRELRDAGVNRLSVGVQSLDAGELAVLGRAHSPDAALAALGDAADVFPGRWSADLIYALPAQTPRHWRDATLRPVLALNPPHVSLYELTLEPGTALHRRREQLQLPDTDEQLEFLEVNSAEMEHYWRYEVSNYCLPGAHCEHNLGYWECDDWIGLGPGAHGRVTIDGVRWAQKQCRAPRAWAAAAAALAEAPPAPQPACNEQEEWAPLSAAEQWGERVLMGLRSARGVPAEFLAPSPPLAAYLEQGLLRRDAPSGRVAATERGWAVLNAVTAELIAAQGGPPPQPQPRAAPAVAA
eukprot:TRINITY_DN70092_c0_g1_i1.p1 TRINITY_DN70092_c0_g1~~TRINITY_DN70092_c0_g1_i1.p1  ORF type:complete len:448 (+),score=137.12 TRINITY_DN70092_c0_g1_i1:98-1345(+)